MWVRFRSIRVIVQEAIVLGVYLPAFPNLASTHSAKVRPDMSSDFPALQESLTVKIPTLISSIATKNIKFLNSEMKMLAATFFSFANNLF